MLTEIFIAVIIFLLLLAFCIYWIYGGFRSGRQTGGVYMLYAPPSEGKTYVATSLILDYLRSGRLTFSNYPVISPDMKLISKVWKKEMMKEQIQGAAIFIDESYKDYNSREYKTFSRDDHDWFATSGHNENSVWLLTQNPQRIDVVIREVVNFYVFVEKKEIPLLGIPLFFNLYYFRSEEDMKVSKYGFAEPWDVQRIWFNWFTAASYDTRYFRKPYDKPYLGYDWNIALLERGFVYKPPIPTGIAWLKIELNRQREQIYIMVQKRVSVFLSYLGRRNDRNLEKDNERFEEKKESPKPEFDETIFDEKYDINDEGDLSYYEKGDD